MTFSHEKLVIFRLKPSQTMQMRCFNILLVLSLLLSWSAHAQKDEKTLRQSNDFVYEGNEKVEDNFVEAEMEYRKAISKLPSNAVGSYNLGTSLFSTGNYSEAMVKLVDATKNASTKKEKHRAFHNIGNAFMQQELCPEAVEAYKNALRNDPTDDESRYNLALAKECAKNQGGGEGENEEEQEEENQDENENKDDQQDQGENEQDDNQEGNEDENKNEGDDNEDENGKPNEDKSDNPQNNPGNKQRKPQPGKLSPQQVKNLLEAMNNQEKKVQEKINARKAKGVKVRTEKDW